MIRNLYFLLIGLIVAAALLAVAFFAAVGVVLYAAKAALFGGPQRTVMSLIVDQLKQGDKS